MGEVFAGKTVPIIPACVPFAGDPETLATACWF
jgi:hypothetical protein